MTEFVYAFENLPMKTPDCRLRVRCAQSTNSSIPKVDRHTCKADFLTELWTQTYTMLISALLSKRSQKHLFTVFSRNIQRRIFCPSSFISQKRSTVDVLLGSKYASGFCFTCFGTNETGFLIWIFGFILLFDISIGIIQMNFDVYELWWFTFFTYYLLLFLFLLLLALNFTSILSHVFLNWPWNTKVLSVCLDYRITALTCLFSPIRKQAQNSSWKCYIT